MSVLDDIKMRRLNYSDDVASEDTRLLLDVVDRILRGRTPADMAQRYRFYAECHEQEHRLQLEMQDSALAKALEGIA